MSLLYHSGMPCCRSNIHEHICASDPLLAFLQLSSFRRADFCRCPWQLSWSGAEWGRTRLFSHSLHVHVSESGSKSLLHSSISGQTVYHSSSFHQVDADPSRLLKNCLLPLASKLTTCGGLFLKQPPVMFTVMGWIVSPVKKDTLNF